MNYEVLDSEKDLITWKRVLSLLPENLQDIYFFPEYVRMYRFIEGSRALMFKCQEGEKIWLYPFLLQPIDSNKYSLTFGPYFDIETAYGYGGPLTNCKDRFFLSSAYDQFSDWCKEMNVVAEFIRFHPLINNYEWIDSKVDIEFDRMTVSLSLENYEVDNTPFDFRVRNKIKRAYKANVKICIFDVDEYFNDFEKLYLSTMSRVKASAFYYFNEKYYLELSALIGKYGMLIGAILGDKFVGAALFLKSKYILHYHLSATDSYNRVPGITNALISKAIEFGANQGLRVLHLGGGNSNAPDDPLLKFKKGMGNHLHKFYVGKRIHNAEIYNLLCRKWAMNYPKSFDRYKKRLLCYRFHEEN